MFLPECFQFGFGFRQSFFGELQRYDSYCPVSEEPCVYVQDCRTGTVGAIHDVPDYFYSVGYLDSSSEFPSVRSWLP